jgi:hypothetical protein
VGKAISPRFKKKPVLLLPILIAGVLGCLAAYDFYLYWLDESQTTILVAVIAAVVALEKMLEKSGVYRRWRIG